MLPCEVAAKNVSAIKAKLAKALKKKGKSQKEIAEMLGVTEAAVSQYLSGKRAKAAKLKEKTKSIFCICKECGVCKLR